MGRAAGMLNTVEDICVIVFVVLNFQWYIGSLFGVTLFMSTSKTALCSLDCKTRAINPELNCRDEIKLNRRRIWWNEVLTEGHSLVACIPTENVTIYTNVMLQTLSPRSHQPETEWESKIIVIKRKTVTSHKPPSADSWNFSETFSMAHDGCGDGCE